MSTPPPIPHAAKPKLTWYQHVWIGWPIALVAVGGAAWALNQKVFRATKHPSLHYLWTGLISIAAIILYFIVAATFLSLFPNQQ